jgi:hypothetical protein
MGAVPGSWILTTSGTVKVTNLSSAFTICIASPVVTSVIATIIDQSTIKS